MIASKGTGTATALALSQGSTAPVSEADEFTLRYNEGLTRPEISVDGAPYVPLATGGTGLLVFATVGAMSAYDDTLIVDDHTPVFVGDVRDWFVLETASVEVADGITVVVTNSGVGRWIRSLSYNAYWQAQDEWHINHAAGDDTNDGATALTALATHAELERRLGTALLLHSIDIYIDDDMTEDVNIRWSMPGEYPAGVYLATSYHGSSTVLASGKFTAGTTPYVPGPGGVRGFVEDMSLPAAGFAPYVGMLFVLTSGPNAGAVGTITKLHLTDGVKHAYYQPCTDFATYTFDVDPASGETYDILKPTRIDGKIKVWSGAERILWYDLHVHSDLHEFYEGTAFGLSAFVYCVLEGGEFILHNDAGIDFYGSAILCTGACEIVGGVCYVDGCYLGGSLRVGLAGYLGIFADTVSSYSLIAERQGVIEIATGWWATFDAAPGSVDPGVHLAAGSVMIAADHIWGTDNGMRVGIAVDAGASYFYTAGFAPSIENPNWDTTIASVVTAYADLPFNEVSHDARIFTNA
jgi:hypothetical protein